jgi:Family of unknown function (DUF6011)
MVSKEFITAGNATFTIKEPDGTHHTFKVEHVEAKDGWAESWFVKLLTGPDNENSYTYVGKLDLFTFQVNTTKKSERFKESRFLKVLNRVLARIACDDHAAYERHGWKVHHEGKCCKCGRKLTTPESVTLGIGPECIKNFPNWGVKGMTQADEDRMIQKADRQDEEARCRYKMMNTGNRPCEKSRT